MRPTGHLWLFFVILSCQKTPCHLPREVAEVPITLVMQRLEDDVIQAKSAEEMRKILREHPDVAEKFLMPPNTPTKTRWQWGCSKPSRIPT